MKTSITSLVSTMLQAVALLICFSVLPIHGLSAEQIIVIYPTGAYGADANNVQAAIDQLSTSVEGGIIELKSRNIDGVPTAFNFGTSTEDPTNRWYVYVPLEQSGPIEMRGECEDEGYDDDENKDEFESGDDTQQVPQTVILGGIVPIRMWGGGELTIQCLQFQEAYQNAIWVGISDSVTIRNNVFVDTQGSTDSLTRVIRFLGYGNDENQITGTIIIEDNVIDGGCCYFTDGMAFSYINAATRVANNDIYGVNIGIRLTRYAQPFTAVGNNISVHVPALGFVAHGYNGSCGIGGSPAVTIEGNYIESRDDTRLGGAIGIRVDLVDSISTDCEISNMQIKNNDIVLTNALSGIHAFGRSVSDVAAALLFVRNQISENSFSGRADRGIILSALVKGRVSSTVELSNNEIVRNDLQDLDTKFADITLDKLTSDNLVVAYAGDVVIDRGKNNEVIFLPAESDDD